MSDEASLLTSVRGSSSQRLTSTLYIHIPFCEHKCDYCAFATWTDQDHLIDSYVSACCAEIAGAFTQSQFHEDLLPAETIFLGGGTPSLLLGEHVERILAAVPRRSNCEVTIEANPATTDIDRIRAWKRAGVTRVSIGVQSMQESVYRSIGRRQNVDHVSRAVELVKGAGFDSWNVDLIFGAAAETEDQWLDTLSRVLEWNPPHVSAYALTVEPGTPLASQSWRHPDEDIQARRYELADAAFRNSGLKWYEVSNWSRPGHQSRHNQRYWDESNYRGFGCAAHSYKDGHRWWNVRTPQRYIDAVRSATSPVASEEFLTASQRSLEHLLLSIRTRRGIAISEVARIPAELDGLVYEERDRLVLTLRGRLLANEVAIRLQEVFQAQSETSPQ